jgi:hypothetical protein
LMTFFPLTTLVVQSFPKCPITCNLIIAINLYPAISIKTEEIKWGIPPICTLFFHQIRLF